MATENLIKVFLQCWIHRITRYGLTDTHNYSTLFSNLTHVTAYAIDFLCVNYHSGGSVVTRERFEPKVLYNKVKVLSRNRLPNPTNIMLYHNH